MTNRFAFWQLMLLIVIGLEVAALHDNYVDHPVKPVVHLPTTEQIALQMAAMPVSKHAILPAPRRHQ